MVNKKFLLLENNYMSFYTLRDIENLDNVVIYHTKKVSRNKLISFLFNIHNSGRIERYINLPLRFVWDYILFRRLLKKYVPDYIIFTTSWYSDHLIDFFRKNATECKLILRFSDMVTKELGYKYNKVINKIGQQFDGIIVYNQEDAKTYGFTYHSVGYSVIKKDLLQFRRQYDVVFIGAAKGRMNKIREAYNKFVAAGLSCFFYVILVNDEEKKNDGIIYGNKVMSFIEYLSYEAAAKCLFEIVQEGSSGRTYRMMEAIIYNKLLITNCLEIKDTNYYNPEYVQLYNDVSEIDPTFVDSAPQNINFGYTGDFSPIRDLEFIEANW